MARTIKQIQDAIIAAKNADATLAGLNSPSMTAIWLLWTYVVAFCMWTLEVLMDVHKAEVIALLAAGKAHTLRWYVTKAKAFQYGDTLPADTDIYNPVVPAHLIVTNAAAVEVVSGASWILRLKVVKGTDPLAPLGGGELAALTVYMNRVKDAGVHMDVTSGAGDNLHLICAIYYDPLVLDNTGARLDGGTATPVKDAINAFLRDLPFNGLLVLNRLTDAILAVDGVVMFNISYAEANYAMTGYVPFTAEYNPDAGYLVNDEGYFDANVTYTAHELI